MTATIESEDAVGTDIEARLRAAETAIVEFKAKTDAYEREVAILRGMIYSTDSNIKSGFERLENKMDQTVSGFHKKIEDLREKADKDVGEINEKVNHINNELTKVVTKITMVSGAVLVGIELVFKIVEHWK